MYISRIRLRTDADPARLTGKLCMDSSYKEHQLVWQLFPQEPEAERHFLFRKDSQSGRPQYLLISDRLPNPQQEIWEIESKDYCPKLNPGQRLAFQLRANPVITRKDGNGKPKRHDIVMDAKRRLNWKNTPPNQRLPLPALIQETGESWLQDRLQQNGARLSTVKVDGYLQQSGRKRKAKKEIRYSTLDFEGTLEVMDPEMFVPLLFNGIGPAKAFGCGLMLVRRI